MQRTTRIGTTAACVSFALLAMSTVSRAQTIEVISRTPTSGWSTGTCSGVPRVSGDGRYVAFNTTASDYGPSNPGVDVFVLDRVTSQLELTSVDGGGPAGGVGDQVGGISDDGRYVVFLGNNLGDWDWNDFGGDVLVRDLLNNAMAEVTSTEFEPTPHSYPLITADGLKRAFHTTNDWFGYHITSISIWDPNRVLLGSRQGSAGQAGSPDEWVEHPFLSGDGRYCVYQFRDVNGTSVRRYGYGLPGHLEDVVTTSTAAAGHVDPAGVSRDGRWIAYVRRTGTTFATWVVDMQTMVEERVDPTSGPALTTASLVGGITDDGRLVAFSSISANLVSGDTNGVADVFVRDRLHQRTARISVDVLGAQANGASTESAIDATGAAVVFLSAATNLMLGDTNGQPDVFRRTMCDVTFPDGDMDAFGGAPAVFSCAPPLPGHVSAGGDCDDANPAVNPGATEVCNGVDDDCDAAVDEDVAGVAYCFGDGSGTPCPCGNSGATGNGCASSVNANGARVGTLGCASLTNDTLVLAGSGMSDSFALYFQGDAQQGGGAGTAFGDGLRCVSGTVVRLGTEQNVGGASQYPGTGDPSISVRGVVTAPGARYYQVWYRNAAAFCTSATFNLTNGVAVSWTP